VFITAGPTIKLVITKVEIVPTILFQCVCSPILETVPYDRVLQLASINNPVNGVVIVAQVGGRREGC
jgi:hypothetical protein